MRPPRLSLIASRGRLQSLAKTYGTHSAAPISSTRPTASASGLSIEHVRQAIRRLEKNIETPLIESTDSKERRPLLRETVKDGEDTAPSKVQLRLSDSQLRMAAWLNTLNVTKYVTWYPEVSNAHSVIVVR